MDISYQQMYQQLVVIQLLLMIYLAESSKSNFLILVRHRMEDNFFKIFFSRMDRDGSAIQRERTFEREIFSKNFGNSLAFSNQFSCTRHLVYFIRQYLDVDLICLLDQLYIFDSISKIESNLSSKRRKP